MRYYLDTEFIENGITIDLISIGIICEDGREFYAINSDCDFSKASDWVKENVITQLPSKNLNLSDPSISPRQKEESRLWKDKLLIAAEVAQFLGADGFSDALPWQGLNKLSHQLLDSRLPEWLSKIVDRIEWLRPKTYFKTTYRLRGDRPKPEIWTYYGSYDWIVFCQLFGTMMDLPKGVPMYTMDLKQWCKQLGDPELPAQGKGEHSAILDARWNRDVWHFLDNYAKRQRRLLNAMATVTTEDIAEIFKIHGETISTPE